MAFVSDPDDLDRFQILFNPKSGQETVAIRGLGAQRFLDNGVDDTSTTGTTLSAGTSNFTDANAIYDDGSATVAVNDILVVAKQNASDTDVINFYQVDAIVNSTTLTVQAWNPSTQAFDTNPTASTGSDLYYAIFSPTAANGPNGGNVGDGVTMQALYSFCKEEWRTQSDASMDDLIKFVFPLESITREQFELGGATHSDWTFRGDFSRNLIRTGGWEELNVSGVTLNRYTGIITLGSLDSDAQVYYQQHDADTDPSDFVLTGAVNQAINAYDLATPADGVTGFAITGTNTITRNDGGNWATDGYKAGGQITIITAEDSGNNNTFTISTVADAVDGALVVVGTGLTNNAADTTMQAAVDKRTFLKLFVRKKARTYAGSQISDIGVSTLETIVNRFPLAHVVDASITLQDGQLGGYDTASVYQSNTLHTTGADGVTSTEAADGTFTLTSSGSTFNANGLSAGDTLHIDDGGSADVGYYEIKSIDSATVLTCYVEPAGLTGQANIPFTGGESTLDFDVYTGTRDTGGAAGTLAYTSGASTLTITDGGKTFDAGSTVGDETVLDGDMVLVSVTNGDAEALGVYKVGTGGVATTVLTLDATDIQNHVATIAGDTVTYVVLQPGMHLQYLNETQASHTPDVNTIIAAASNTIQIDDAANEDWNTDYNYVVGGNVTISGSSSDDGTYIITGFSTTTTTDDTATVINTDGTAVSFTGQTANTISLSGQYGFLRTLNGVVYSFNWRLYGNAGGLQDCFQWIQRELRRTTDIDGATTMFRGDVNDLLMSFSTPTGTAINMFIDNLVSDDLNNATKQDINGESRNFAFIAGLTINWNTNFQESTDGSRKIVVFFSDPDSHAGSPVAGNEFGTAGALIVDDKDSVAMTVSAAEAAGGTSKSFEYDFDNNAQGGRETGPVAAAEVTAGTSVTVVAIDTEKAQYNKVEGTIKRQNSNIITLAPALERNYSNPA